MKSKTLISVFLIFAIFQLSFQSKTNEGWKLVKDKDGIKAYTCEFEDSEIKQVKVEVNFKSSLSAAISVFKNADTHTNWMYKCFQAKTIKTVSNTEYYYYSESKAPWPISNRDAITCAVIKQDSISKSVRIISTGLPDYLKERDGIVRIRDLHSKWEFTPKENGTIDLTFYMWVDLGGGIPAWIMNLVITDGPFETAQKFIKEVQKEKHQNIKLNYIEELK